MLQKDQPAISYSFIQQFAELRKLIRHVGVYALSSIITPFISLALAPFLTHALSIADYGLLTLLNTVISLGAGITQLGLGTAFFRAYNYDYSDEVDRRAVVATVTMLLLLVSLLVVLVVTLTASFLASVLFGRATLGMLVVIGGGVIGVQNLTIPCFAWLRAENRTFLYSLLSIGNLLITLLANLVLVGVLHWGITGSVLATGGGYLTIVVCTLPVILVRAGLRIRGDIARNVLAFGAPMVLNVVSYWILQLSDRYLLRYFSSLTETAKYSVSYTIGSAISVVVITPFTLAWPSTMYAIARSAGASRIFQLVFRWFSLCLLLAVFSLSCLGVLLLNWLFPVAYRSVAFIIPIVSTSIAFFGLYNLFMIGVNIRRKTWLGGLFTTIAALLNLLLNLVLIPRYGALGAALSTLASYTTLALIAYVVNQRIYPIAFEVGRFVCALALGAVLYLGSSSIAQNQRWYWAGCIYLGAFVLYAACLIMLGLLSGRKRQFEPRTDTPEEVREELQEVSSVH